MEEVVNKGGFVKGTFGSITVKLVRDCEQPSCLRRQVERPDGELRFEVASTAMVAIIEKGSDVEAVMTSWSSAKALQ